MDETFTDEELNGIISDVSELIMYIHGGASSVKGKDTLAQTVSPNITMYNNLYVHQNTESPTNKQHTKVAQLFHTEERIIQHNIDLQKA